MTFSTRLQSVILFLVWLTVVSTFSGQVRAQASAELDPVQLNLLQRMSPSEREALLSSFLSSGGSVAQSPLAFPQLLTSEEDAETADTQIVIYDADGNPLLDEFGKPLVVTSTTLDELKAQASADSADSDVPFFEQEIRLAPFGYDLFEGVPTTFAPATDIPVPNEYRMGPGDTLDVQLFGKENRQYSLVVTRDGTINFPSIGPINVMGRSFQELKQDILDRVSEQLIGTSAAVTMGSLRSINIVVAGDAKRPGSYTVSGLSTITNALFASGGVSDMGSLRKIQLKRDGRVVTTLDLYDLLLSGDARNDRRLESGDVIFIPPIGATVGIGGYVKRPAIYELRNKTATAGAVVSLAGGLRSDAYPEGARLERIESDWRRSFRGLDLNTKQARQQLLQAGDILLVPPVLLDFDDGLSLVGHVKRPGSFEWRPDMRLTDLIQSLDDLQPQADLEYVLIRRETRPEKRVQVISANLAEALRNPDSADNVVLQARDRAYVFSLIDDPENPFSRSVVVSGLLEELSRQSGADMPYERVTVRGEIRVPGEYPFEDGMRVSDLLRAGGALLESAYKDSAELTRYSVVGQKARTSELVELSLTDVLGGEPELDPLLRPGDFLTVRRIQDWANEHTITLEGEVRYPGTYSIRQGETLSSVIERAGGLTDHAFPEGSVFLREELRLREQQQLATLRERLRSDIASISLQAATTLEDTSVVDAKSVGTALLASLNSIDATGRLVIDLPALLAEDGDPVDVLLKDGDQLLIPKRTQAVTVIGEVQFATSHLYAEKLKRDDYIDRSGGLAPNASKKGIYVVRANGAVLAAGRKWGGGSTRIEPGDTIVVPLDTERGFRLQSWASITKIAYNTAVAVAAINGISN